MIVSMNVPIMPIRPEKTGFEVEPAACAMPAVPRPASFEKMPRDGDYTMNHTAGVFLFRADGRFGGIFDYHEDRRFALPKIRRVLT